MQDEGHSFECCIIFFEVGILNFVCGWILGLGSLTPFLGVLSISLCFNPKFGTVDASWDDGVSCTSFWDLISRIIVSGAYDYLLYCIFGW